MMCLHQLIEFANMQLAYRHDERPGESYEALDGKNLSLSPLVFSSLAKTHKVVQKRRPYDDQMCLLEM